MTTDTQDKKTFRDFDLDDRLVDALESQGITHPFPIQELTLPMAIKGHDIIGQARTGTGKTLGFGLPLLQRIDIDQKRTQALVVVPTRELCLQVADDLTIGNERGVSVQTVYGGVGYDEQIEALTNGVHVVVGTPGRLLDHLNKGVLDLRECKIVVLDEADEMLDMGFLPDVERIIAGAPAEGRHTMLFSATMPSAVVKLARRYMTHPTFMRADVEEHETAPTVEQHFLMVHRMDKPRVLARVLQSPGRGNVYVFTRTKRMADRLVEELANLGVDSIAVHGDLRQAARERNMDRFRDGKVSVLVATEVAARGLDVSNVTHVINYDCPDDEKMYLHRIGRTARAGADGVAVTFAEFNEADRVNMIRKAVVAERELLEVFSTSDELTEVFDLPDETPWQHLSKKGGGSSRGSSGRSGSKGSGGRGSGGRGSNGSSSKRKGSTDGRPKSSRSSEGGGEQSSSRRRDSGKKSDDRGRTRDRRPDSDATDVATTPTERDREADEVRTRTRTRTRARSKDQRSKDSGGSDDDGSRGRSRDQRDRSSSKSSSGSGSSSSGRTRARARSSESGGSKRDSGSSKRDRDRNSGGSSRDRGSSSGSSREGGRERSRGGSRDGGSGRTRNDDRGGRDRDDRGQRDRTVRPTASGDDARGDGDPQLARRVKVEHLP